MIKHEVSIGLQYKHEGWSIGDIVDFSIYSTDRARFYKLWLGRRWFSYSTLTGFETKAMPF